MAIKRIKPITIPEVIIPETVYEFTYLLGIDVDASRPGEPVNASIRTAPFDGKSILVSKAKTLSVSDIFALAALDKDIAAIATGLVTVASKLNDIAEELGVDRIDADVLAKYIKSQPEIKEEEKK